MKPYITGNLRTSGTMFETLVAILFDTILKLIPFLSVYYSNIGDCNIPASQVDALGFYMTTTSNCSSHQTASASNNLVEYSCLQASSLLYLYRYRPAARSYFNTGCFTSKFLFQCNASKFSK